MQSSDYQAISRTFRPSLFADVTGQEPIVTALKNAIQKGQVSHAYLFSGIRGTGKTTLARILAKALNCESLSSDGEPCNVCSSCKAIKAGQSLDVLEIDGASNRGIDDIRSLNETLGYATFKGKNKVFIIDEVHMLTKEAFNALLKTLEEPPKNVKFFLATTEPHKLPPTILSRCQRFDLSRISNAEIIQKLRYVAKSLAVSVDDEAFSAIAKLAEGSLRDAESLFDQIVCLGESPITAKNVESLIGLPEKALLFALDEAYAKGDLASAFTLSMTFFESGRDLSVMTDLLFDHYRNIALILLEKLDPKSTFATEMDINGYSQAAEIYTHEQAFYILDYLTKTLYHQTRPVLKRVHLEMLLLHILQTKSRVSVSSLISHLQSLKNNASMSETPEEIAPSSKEDLPGVTSLTESAESSHKKTPENPSSPISTPKVSACEIPEPKEPSEKEDQIDQPVLKEERPPLPKIKSSVRHDTLMRFASVELGGSLSK